LPLPQKEGANFKSLQNNYTMKLSKKSIQIIALLIIISCSITFAAPPPPPLPPSDVPFDGGITALFVLLSAGAMKLFYDKKNNQ
jgi:hypothetical protein